MTSPPLVRIRYRRPPDRLRIYEQPLLLDTAEVKVTLAERVELGSTLEVDGRVALEDGAPAVWFTFPGAWHDIGRFHTADGTFTGIYANILTPVELASRLLWDTTDLFVDLWLDDRGARVLDRDEFDGARARGWIGEPTAVRALAEVERLRAAAESGSWPPPVVGEWTLARARAVLGG